MRASSKYKLMMSSNPNSYISEKYRVLRTNIQFAASAHSSNVMMVTSSQPQEGKSTITANLAVAYAQAKQRVVVIDADFRRPTLHRFFKNLNQRGLSNLLSESEPLSDIIARTSIDHLYIIPSGPEPMLPSELLASDRMDHLLADLKRKFDYILIDSPPILLTSDTQILSRKVDGVLFVVNSGKVKQSQAQKALAKLEYAQANLLGIVLNNGKRDRQEAYYYRS